MTSFLRDRPRVREVFFFLIAKTKTNDSERNKKERVRADYKTKTHYRVIEYSHTKQSKLAGQLKGTPQLVNEVSFPFLR